MADSTYYVILFIFTINCHSFEHHSLLYTTIHTNAVSLNVVFKYLTSLIFQNPSANVIWIMSVNKSIYSHSNVFQLTYADIVFSVYTEFGPTVVGSEIDMNRWPRLKAVREMVNNTGKIKEWIDKRPVTVR